MAYVRVPIAVEGRDMGLNYISAPGSIQWDPDAEIPIVSHMASPVVVDFPLGYGRNVQREEDGTITIEVPEELIIVDEHYGVLNAFSAWTKSVKWSLAQNIEGPTRIERQELMAVQSYRSRMSRTASAASTC